MKKEINFDSNNNNNTLERSKSILAKEDYNQYYDNNTIKVRIDHYTFRMDSTGYDHTNAMGIEFHNEEKPIV